MPGLFAKTRNLFIVLAGLALLRGWWQRQKVIDLRGKVVLITGGSRGLGLAIAQAFAREGARTAICARDDEELARAQAQLNEAGIDTLALRCDVTSPDDVSRVVGEVTTRFGHIDVLVNNAGIISVGPWQTLTRQDFEESMNIMFWGTYNMTMAVLPRMAERRFGRIVNIGSIGGKVSVPHLLPYASAKFAVTGFSEGLHAEVARQGIVVTTVSPGLMRTGSPVNTIMKGEQHQVEYTLFDLLDTLPFTSTSAQNAAQQIVRATRRGEAELIITVQAQLAARLYGAFPGLMTDLLDIANRFLPHGEYAGQARYTGYESETPLTQSPITALGQQAAQEYNELPTAERKARESTSSDR